LPGQGQDAVGKATYRVPADEDEIVENTFLFQILEVSRFLAWAAGR